MIAVTEGGPSSRSSTVVLIPTGTLSPLMKTSISALATGIK